MDPKQKIPRRNKSLVGEKINEFDAYTVQPMSLCDIFEAKTNNCTVHCNIQCKTLTSCYMKFQDTYQLFISY